MKKRVTLLNISLSLLLQVVSVISALIVPRLILSTFGSSVNGLTASITQFLNYIALIEGGITGVIAANLYKPLVDKDWSKLSSVLSTARAFYQKIGLIFVGYTIVLGLVYPHVVDTGLDSLYVFVLTCVLSVGLLLQYMFSLTMTTLLNADKKGYVVSLLSIFVTIGNIGLIILVVKLYPDIILLKAVGAALFVLKPIVFGVYIKKHYAIDWHAPTDNTLIKQRWNGFAINLAFFIHVSTDVTILTLMCDLKTVSVYTVYFLIVSKISVLIHSVASGIEPTIGQAYAKNDARELHEKLDLYEYITFFSVGILFSLMALLITPFVLIYTDGINDADYNQPVFGSLIVLAEALYLLKYPHVTLSYVANKFKEITASAYVEVAINIVVSIVLIKPFGLVGLAIGTASGMLYRMIFHVFFTRKMIPDRRQSIFYRKLLILLVASTFGVLLCQFVFPFSSLTVYSWIIHALVYGIVFVGMYAIVSGLFFRREINYFIKYIKKK